MKMIPFSRSGPSRPLTLDPILSGGLDIVGAIDALRAGLPVGWTMEPGDATRYRIIIVPLWTGKDLRLAASDDGIGTTGNRWFFLVKPSDGNALVMPGCGLWDLLGKDRMTRNGWTARVVSGLVRGIWYLIDHPEMNPADYTFTEEERYGAAQS